MLIALSAEEKLPLSILKLEEDFSDVQIIPTVNTCHGLSQPMKNARSAVS
jgi:hypothetical protein